MATYGHPISSSHRPTDSSCAATVGSILRRLVGVFALCCGLSLTSGCSTTMAFGSLPRIDRLESLKIGTSGAGEVLLALGEPRGRGQAKLGPNVPEQQIWFYEYTKSDGKKVQLKMLLVFMDKDVYAGHMWFSSRQLLGVTQ